jgi:hypothetical protein
MNEMKKYKKSRKGKPQLLKHSGKCEFPTVFRRNSLENFKSVSFGKELTRVPAVIWIISESYTSWILIMGVGVGWGF